MHGQFVSLRTLISVIFVMTRRRLTIVVTTCDLRSPSDVCFLYSHPQEFAPQALCLVLIDTRSRPAKRFDFIALG